VGKPLPTDFKNKEVMNSAEFSDQFDVLYNNITSNQAPGLSEYEKSVFLTKAQDEIIKNYFLPQSNPKQAGFDGNQKRQMDFSRIISSDHMDNEEFNDPIYDTRTPNVSVYLPSDVWIIINERVTVTRDSNTVHLTVLPIAFDKYDALMSKPYKRPLKYQAWRLIVSEEGSGSLSNGPESDLIVGPNDTITGYSIRYVKRPKPVIIGPLDGLSINGCTFGTGTNQADGCELDPILHEEILQRAVELAKIAWTATGQDNVQLEMAAGQRSE
jgi:hypothetical protein